MEVGDLLIEVQRRGVELWPNSTGDRLRFAPASALTPELVAELRRHKTQLLSRLCVDLSTDPAVHRSRGATPQEAKDYAAYDRMVFATMERLGVAHEKSRKG